MFDLTTPLKREATAANGSTGAAGPDPSETMTGIEATKRLADYYNQPSVRQDANSVIVVAYDVVPEPTVPRAF